MIRTGDTVDVYFESVEAEFRVKVLYMPDAPGACWQFVRADGTPVYVQMFAKMVRSKL